jgi:hypothetical protein
VVYACPWGDFDEEGQDWGVRWTRGRLIAFQELVRKRFGRMAELLLSPRIECIQSPISF